MVPIVLGVVSVLVCYSNAGLSFVVALTVILAFLFAALYDRNLLPETTFVIYLTILALLVGVLARIVEKSMGEGKITFTRKAEVPFGVIHCSSDLAWPRSAVARRSPEIDLDRCQWSAKHDDVVHDPGDDDRVRGRAGWSVRMRRSGTLLKTSPRF